jgi:aldehyde dehydrogenase
MKPKFKEKYSNFINGKFVAPIGGQYFDNTFPIDNSFIAKYSRSQKEDVELALDTANAAKESWGNTLATERSKLLLKVADIIEANLEEFALVET